MRAIFGIQPGWGITVVRLAMGLITVVAGYQKFVVGPSAVAAFWVKNSYAIPTASIVAPYIAVQELIGGLLLILGLLTRWVGLLFACEFLVTAFWVRFRLLGWMDGRLDLMLLAGAIMLFLAGPGRAAIDEVWFEKRA